VRPDEGKRSTRPGVGADSAVVLGRFGAPFGVQGWVKLTSYTDPPEGIVGYTTWLAGTSGRTFAPRDWKRVGQGQLAVRLDGVDTRDQAEVLRGAEVWVPRAELPAARPGEYYFVDLIGLEADNPAGDALGKVAEILQLPAHPVLVLRGERERLVPLVPERLVKVDLAAGRVTLDWHRDD